MALINRNESRNFNAASAIDDKTVMYMNASYNTSNGQLSFSKTIQDMDTYKLYKAQVDQDYEDFQDDVESKVMG